MKIIAVIIICVALIACQSDLTSPEPVKTPIPPDLEISLERGPCYGTCPIYKVTVDNHGQVYFVGKRFVAFQSMMSTVSQEQLQRLIEAIESSNYFTLPESYARLATDLPSATTIITMNGKSKRIWHYGLHCNPEYDSAPQALCDLENLIDEVTGTRAWVIGEPTETVTSTPSYPASLLTPDAKILNEQWNCLLRKGKWEVLGFGGFGCNYPTTDSGKSCVDDLECEGACLGNLDEALRQVGLSRSSLSDFELIKQVNERGMVTGTCSPFIANFGGHLFVRNGQLDFVYVD